MFDAVSPVSLAFLRSGVGSRLEQSAKDYFDCHEKGENRQFQPIFLSDVRASFVWKQMERFGWKDLLFHGFWHKRSPKRQPLEAWYRVSESVTRGIVDYPAFHNGPKIERQPSDQS